MKKCRILENKKASKHPHLEPPCYFVYMLMTDKEKEENDKRCYEHLKVHVDNVYTNIKEI